MEQIFHLVNREGWSNQRGSEAWKRPKMREIIGYLKEIVMEVPGRAGKKLFKYSNTKIWGGYWGWNSRVSSGLKRLERGVQLPSSVTIG